MGCFVYNLKLDFWCLYFLGEEDRQWSWNLQTLNAYVSEHIDVELRIFVCNYPITSNVKIDLNSVLNLMCANCFVPYRKVASGTITYHIFFRRCVFLWFINHYCGLVFLVSKLIFYVKFNFENYCAIFPLSFCVSS